MKGKLLKVFGNDLHGTVDDRVVIFFAAFNHKKYSTKYGLFVFKDELNQNKLYFASIHIKDNSLVTFSIKKEQFNIIDAFLEEYTQNKFEEFELIDITNQSKIELVGYNEKEYNNLIMLYNISIPVEKPKEVKETKKTNILSILITVLILLVSSFGLYWFFHPRLFNPLVLNCVKQGADDEIIANYNKNKTITFNKKDLVKEIKSNDIYSFKGENNYYNFKADSKHYLYFNNLESFEYIDETKELKIYYLEESNHETYDEIKTSLEKEGYICKDE